MIHYEVKIEPDSIKYPHFLHGSRSDLVSLVGHRRRISPIPEEISEKSDICGIPGSSTGAMEW